MHIIFDEIISIESISCESNRYDITVQDNHNFFANDVLVHNCQNLKHEIFDLHYNELYEMSIKLDGSSMTVYYHDNGDTVRKGVCSRNLDLDLNQEGNAFVDTANKLRLHEALATHGRNIALQGELVGPGIQGNKENLSELDFYVYNIYDIDAGKFLDPDSRCRILGRIQLMSGIDIKHVPILGYFNLKDFNVTDIASLLAIAEGASLNAEMREGIVFKSCDSDFQFKAISNTWLEKYGD